MKKVGEKDYKSYSKKILKIYNNKPVSLQIFADEYKEMKKKYFRSLFEERISMLKYQLLIPKVFLWIKLLKNLII